MACKSPYRVEDNEFNCGRCLSCRIIRKKTWKFRLLLEANSHRENSFITLTYDEENLPTGRTLKPDDVKKFMGRLRQRLKHEKNLPKKFRYFYVGEYGSKEKGERPHYHFAMFGLSCRGPNPRGYDGKNCTCDTCRTIDAAWGKGLINVGTLENDSCSYLAGYLQKTVIINDKTVMGLTDPNDPGVQKYLKGRHPEFNRMSLKPGIGGDSVDEIVNGLTSTFGKMYLDNHGDVPHSLDIGGNSYPIGRYLRERIREKLGYTDQNKNKRDYINAVYEADNVPKKDRKIIPKKFAPPDAMQKLLAEKAAKDELLFEKAKKIGKNPWFYKEQLTRQKYKQTEIKAAMNAVNKGRI